MLRSKGKMCIPHSINHDSLPPSTDRMATCTMLDDPTWVCCFLTFSRAFGDANGQEQYFIVFTCLPTSLHSSSSPLPLVCVWCTCVHSHTFLCGWGCAYATTYMQRSEVKPGCHSSLSALRKGLCYVVTRPVALKLSENLCLYLLSPHRSTRITDDSSSCSNLVFRCGFWGLKLRSSHLNNKHFYQLSHLPSLHFSYIFNVLLIFLWVVISCVTLLLFWVIGHMT